MSKKRTVSGGWAAIIPLSLAMAAYLGFIFLPEMKEIRAMRAEIADKQQYLQGDAVRTARFKNVSEEEIEIRDYLRQWRGSSTKPSDTAHALAEVSARAQDSGVGLTTFRPEPKQPMAVVERVPFTLGCVGTIDQLQTLLASLEQMNERLWFDEITIQHEGQTGQMMKGEIKAAIFADNFPISD